MPILAAPRSRLQGVLRVVLSYYVTNGVSAAIGLMLISGSIHLLLGAFAASAASVGVIVCIPPDQAAPKRGKFWHLLPAALIGLPLFYAVQVLHAAPIRLGLLLVPATFIAFLAAAWGKQGLPIAVSVMFAMVFSMAMPEPAAAATALSSSLYFALGAASYLVWATLANTVLNGRYRVQILADTLLSLATLMQTQARQFTRNTAAEQGNDGPLVGQLLQQQAALADQLQTARNMLLETPSTPQRQRLAGILLGVLEMRDYLLACELDLDTVKSDPGAAPVLHALRELLETLAEAIAQLADALLIGRQPAPFDSRRRQLAVLSWFEDRPPAAPGAHPSLAMLARGLSSRVGHINDETVRLMALARNETSPDLAVVRTAWQMFVSPVAWSWRPFVALWRWSAPPLRHAVRAALAIGTAYAVSLALPWGTHDYWILLTIVVVLRGSLAQTLERRNSRVLGTLMGCILAGALLFIDPPVLVLIVIVTVSQALAHAFAIKRYLVTAVAATVLGLLQAHLINAGASPAFAVVERIADTLIGVAIAWAFSYVLPSWERSQLPALMARTLAAQAHHARIALGLSQLQAVDNAPELEWRLARREAYDSLSALVQTTQRSLSEPRAVRPPLASLERLLAHSYQLLAQLTAVKTMLLLRRGRLKSAQLRAPLMQAAETIAITLSASQPASNDNVCATEGAPGPVTLPDPFDSDLSPWVLRRLDLATNIARQVRNDAHQVRQAASS